jgi:hypothetical protein
MAKTWFWAKVMIPVLVMALGIPVPTRADQFRYTFPPNLTLTLEPDPAIGKTNDAARHLVGMIEARTGTPRFLEIFFESSADLRVVTAGQKVEALKEHTTHRVAVEVERTGKPASELGSWVKIGVRYRPDYERLQTIMSDPSAFPVDFERDRMLTILRANQRRAAKHLDAVRVFLPRRSAP